MEELRVLVFGLLNFIEKIIIFIQKMVFFQIMSPH